jgi:hypothetical protein
MTDLALWVIRVLRALPHTARFDKHLTDCAALAVVYGPFDDTLERLRLSHVFRLSPLPDFFPGVPHVTRKRVEESVSSYDEPRRGLKPPVYDARFFLKRGLNTLH